MCCKSWKREFLFNVCICSSMKHASLLRQTVALLPLRFCTCNQDFLTQKLVQYCLWSLFTHSNRSQFCIHIAWQNRFPLFVLRPGLWVRKHDGLFYFGSWKHVLCAKSSQNHLIFSSFLQEDSETSIQKNLGRVLHNWFLADSVKIISVAVHTSKSWKVKKSDSWQLVKNEPWQKKPTDSG